MHSSDELDRLVERVSGSYAWDYSVDWSDSRVNDLAEAVTEIHRLLKAGEVSD